MSDWLPIMLGSAIGPLVTWAIKRIPAVKESGSARLGAAINLAVCVVLFVIVGAILPRLYPELPRDIDTWAQLGLAAGGIGGAGNNVWQKAVVKRQVRRPRKPAKGSR